MISVIFLAGSAFPQASQYNSMYRGEDGDVFSRKPNAFLVEAVRTRKPGAALDVGLGQGRNAIFLARQGWDVTGIDLADEGVSQARAEAERLGLNRWDLIVLTYVPTKAIAPRVVHALRPGGSVLVEDRHLDTRRVWPAGTFGNNELISLFPGLRVLRYDDLWARPDWSAKPKVDQRLVRLVAEKPLAPLPGCVWEAKPVPEGGTVCWDTARLRCGPDGWLFTREKCAP